MRKRLMLVEDDEALACVLSGNLGCAGFEVQWLQDGAAVVTRLREFRPDLILLDVMLPGKDGFDVCRAVRAENRTPVIMLTARDQKGDKLMGLEMGADDYLTKPFDFDELVARIRAVLRRVALVVSTLRFGSLVVDLTNRRATDSGRSLHLTAREFDLLSYLSERRGRTVYRAELLREVWGFQEEPRTRAVDYAIKRLRQKIEPDPHRPRFIHSMRGDGYCLTFDDPQTA
jgi:DNA-binding response OmpR family regulator